MGGRGIIVCDNWRTSFPAFLKSLGDCPPKMSVDRKDNNGNYSCGDCDQCRANGWPMNCRWATALEQVINSDNHIIRITIDGETKLLRELLAESGVTVSAYHARVATGWNQIKAATQPMKKKTIASCSPATAVEG